MKINPKFIVFIGALGISMSPIFIKLSESQALTIAFYRMLITVIILTPFAVFNKKNELKKIPMRSLFKIIISGIFLGLHFSVWIMSLKYTTVASATVLVNMSPIILLLITYFLLKEKVSKIQVTAVIAAFIGSGILSFGDFFGAPNAILGDVLAILGAVFVSIYLLIGNRVRQSLSMTSYTYLTYSVATLTIFVINIFVGHSLIVTNTNEFYLFIAMAIFPTLLGHSMFNYALKYISATFISMAILIEPILASIIAIFLLSEIPTGLQVMGSIVILSALVIYNNSVQKV